MRYGKRQKGENGVCGADQNIVYPHMKISKKLRMNTAGEQEMTVCKLLFLRSRNDSWRQLSPTQCRVICCGILR